MKQPKFIGIKYNPALSDPCSTPSNTPSFQVSLRSSVESRLFAKPERIHLKGLWLYCFDGAVLEKQSRGVTYVSVSFLKVLIWKSRLVGNPTFLRKNIMRPNMIYIFFCNLLQNSILWVYPFNDGDFLFGKILKTIRLLMINRCCKCFTVNYSHLVQPNSIQQIVLSRNTDGNAFFPKIPLSNIFSSVDRILEQNILFSSSDSRSYAKVKVSVHNE